MRWSLIALALLATACPGKSHEATLPTRCTEIGDKCTLGGGVLGVCSESLCAGGQSGPCMKCTSQH